MRYSKDMFSPNFIRFLKSAGLFFLTAFIFFNSTFVFAQKPNQTNVYFPGENWEKRMAWQVGLDETKLKSAVDFAIANEAKAPRNLEFAHFKPLAASLTANPSGHSRIAANRPELLSVMVILSPNGANQIGLI